jgi:hypothetical protein
MNRAITASIAASRAFIPPCIPRRLSFKPWRSSLNWHNLPTHLHQERDMLQARLKSLEIALSRIIEIADDHEDPDEALMTIADIAEAARKL